MSVKLSLSKKHSVMGVAPLMAVILCDRLVQIYINLYLQYAGCNMVILVSEYEKHPITYIMAELLE